jgi:hypothetical protein
VAQVVDGEDAREHLLEGGVAAALAELASL